MLRAKIIEIEDENYEKEIDNAERKGVNPFLEKDIESARLELQSSGLSYAKKALELNVEKPFENPVLHILVPRDLVNLRSLFLKASFELMIGLYANAVQTYSIFIDEHEESRHYQIK